MVFTKIDWLKTYIRSKSGKLLLLSVAAILALSPNAAAADGLNLLLNGRSFHLEEKPGVNYNESNIGTGFQYDFKPNGDGVYAFLNVGGFKDSFEENSYYTGGGLAKRFRSEKQIHVDVGVTAFLMTRKDRNDNKPFPGLLPMMTVGTDRVAVNLTYVPKTEPKGVDLFFIQLKIAVGQ